MFRLIGVIVVVAVIFLWYFDAFTISQDDSGNVNVTIQKERAQEAVRQSQEAAKAVSDKAVELTQ